MKTTPVKHTPGPWGTIFSDPDEGWPSAVGSPDGVVCRLGGYTPTTGAQVTWPANANLIAAAPDLLAAGKAVAALWAKHGLGDDDAEGEPVWNALRHAIAKAEGTDEKRRTS